MSKFAVCSIMCASVFSATLQAQEQRWFEVEMLIFSQTPPAPLQEQFGESVTPIKPGRAYDLLTSLLQPQISGLLHALPLCDNTAAASAELSFTFPLMQRLCIIEPQPLPWQQYSLFEPRYVDNRLPYPSQLPAVITGKGEHQDRPYLAASDALQLTEIAQRIKRQSGTSLLLHTSWRQAPVTERRAIASRWFGGKNYSAQFDYWGQPVAERDTAIPVDVSPLVTADPLASAATVHQSNEMLVNIELLLQQLAANGQLPAETHSPLPAVNNADSLALRNLPEQVWQLDGLFKLHLDHYLFVNTEFNLRLPATDSLQTIYVRQSRRVISGEIHYLDHPYLGIVLQIRRYEPPAATPAQLTTEMDLLSE
jgi:hypothetical protein